MLRPLEEKEEAGLWLGAGTGKVNTPVGPEGGAVAPRDTFTAATADFCANRVPVTQRHMRNVPHNYT